MQDTDVYVKEVYCKAFQGCDLGMVQVFGTVIGSVCRE